MSFSTISFPSQYSLLVNCNNQACESFLVSLFFSERQAWRILQVVLYCSLLAAGHLTWGTKIGPNGDNVDDRHDDDEDGNKNDEDNYLWRHPKDN